jgi:anti-anti-sigma factor
MRPLEFNKTKDTIIIHLDSDLNSCGIVDIEGLVDDIMDADTITVAVDCKKLFVLDPATISRVAACMKKARSNKMQLVLLNLNPDMQLMFEMMNLDGFFTSMTQERFEKDYMKHGAAF